MARRLPTVIMVLGLLPMIALPSGAILQAAPGNQQVAADRTIKVAGRSSIKARPGRPAGAPSERSVRDYILAHPEIVPEALQQLQDQHLAKLIATHRRAIETPFASAWAGAADGDITLVEFTDFACGFCRASRSDVTRLLGSDRRLRVVYREIPVISPMSLAAARAALAAAAQGRYSLFRDQLYAAGPLTAESLALVIGKSGLDQTRLAAASSNAAITGEIKTNLALARALNLPGTPSYVIGGQVLSGAVGYDALKQAVATARARRGGV